MIRTIKRIWEYLLDLFVNRVEVPQPIAGEQIDLSLPVSPGVLQRANAWPQISEEIRVSVNLQHRAELKRLCKQAHNLYCVARGGFHNYELFNEQTKEVFRRAYESVN